MVSVAIGRLDRRATLQRKTITRGAMGGSSETWATIATVWAEKLDIRGREFFAAQQVNAEITTRFRLRYRSDIHPGCRITCEGKTYDITSVAELDRRRWLEIMANAVHGGSEVDFD